MKKLIAILTTSIMILCIFNLVVEVRGLRAEAWISMDKLVYEPGEKGNIHITIRNIGNDPIEVRNVTIEFNEWKLYTEDGWDSYGNKSVIYDPPIIVSSKSAVALDPIAFTVPTDARALSTSPILSIHTNEGKLPENDIMGQGQVIEVIDSYSLRYLKGTENTVTLLTVIAVLTIIGAMIVAAAIFLSGRRPRPI